MFLPATREECDHLGWKKLDIILVTGDAYVDSPYFGTAVIGKYLLSKGFKVGVIPQPDISSNKDITALGEPLLYWGVSAGCVDSMVSNYTPLKKKRNEDDLTAGGKNNRRPDRACIAYTNLIRRNFKNTVPVILGGIEASLRRIAHYDFWDDSVRRSILIDAKADAVIYGMGEKTSFELADALQKGEEWRSIKGICYKSKTMPDDAHLLPSYEEASTDKKSFINMFAEFSQNNDALTAKTLAQKHADTFVVQNPPQTLISTDELDEIYEYEYEHKAHPVHDKEGKVKALDTVKFSVTAHRGCYGECSFCAISAHQGRTVISRSEDSIMREVAQFMNNPEFKGIVYDMGGPTANMYGFECDKKMISGPCSNKHCLFPSVCHSLKVNHHRQMNLLKSMRTLKGIKKVFVASGIRYDLIFADKNGEKYLNDIVQHHVSGQMKIAPEHTITKVLSLMGKPAKSQLVKFKELFDSLNEHAGKKQFLTYYFIAAHPGCTEEDMRSCGDFSRQVLKHRPQQVQIFTPTPSTWSACMYYTETNPYTGERIFVEKNPQKKEAQKKTMGIPSVIQFNKNRHRRPVKKT
jgi:uncharacterized radical SAM protein YgiQ